MSFLNIFFKQKQGKFSSAFSADAIQKFIFSSNKGWVSHIPDFQYCTDNAAMIGASAYFKFIEGEFGKLIDKPNARLPFIL